jgi:tetratricopeptide (TPR) repeat protein
MQPAVRAVIENAYKQASQDNSATLRLAMLLHAHQENTAAEAVYARAHALNPKHGPTLYYWAQILAARGDHATAVDRLRAIHSPSLPARLLLANSLRESGANQDAAAICREIIAQHPGSATAHYLLGRATGDASEYATALQLFPRYGAARFALAALYRQQGQAEAAAKILADYERDKLMTPSVEDPDNEALAELSVGPTGLLRRAVREESAGRLREAAALQRQALAMEPNLPDAWANLISLEARLGNDKAVQDAYNQSPANNAAAHYNYGVHCLQKQRFPDAAKAFRKTLGIAPNHAEAALNLAGIVASEGKADEAVALLNNAATAKPDFAQAHYQLARLLAAKAHYPRALDEFNKAVKFARSDAERAPYLYGLGVTTARSGDLTNARAILQDALSKASAAGQMDLAEAIRSDLSRLNAAK